MATMPVFYCQIAFTSGPYAASPTWVDVSADLVSFSIKRGRQYQIDRFQAGTATVLLKNLNGNYWPDNTGGAYYPNVDLRKLIQVYAIYNGVTYFLYTGYIRQWLPTWYSTDILTQPAMQLDVADGIRNISSCTINNAGYVQELGGARVNDVLNTVGWAASWRSIASGQVQMAVTTNPLTVGAMTHLDSVQDSENGIIWVRGDGYLIFQDSTTRLQAPYLTSNATFGDGNLTMYSPQFPKDDDLLFNDVQLTRTGGVLQQVDDIASQTTYGLSSLTKSGLLLVDDNTVLNLAQYLLSRYHVPVTRFKTLMVQPQYPGQESLLWPQALGREISDRITVIRTEAGLNKDYYIEGISHSWDYRKGQYQTTWMLSDVEAASSYWILGQAGNSELGLTTKLWW